MQHGFNDSLWEYLSPHQKDLLITGEHLKEYVLSLPDRPYSDYSFIVFPYAKAYEGFLKQLFLDIDYITEEEYESDFLRLGKLLSPNGSNGVGNGNGNGTASLYNRIRDEATSDLAKKIWQTWKRGRNELFHYFPHNYKQATLEEALEIIDNIKEAMQITFNMLFVKCKVRKSIKYT